MNAAAIKEVHDRDLRAFEPEFPCTFYWGGIAYPCIRDEIAGSLTGGDVGFMQDYDFALIVRLSVYPAGITPPVVNSPIEVVNEFGKHIQCYIATIKPSQDNVAWTYGVKAKN